MTWPAGSSVTNSGIPARPHMATRRSEGDCASATTTPRLSEAWFETGLVRPLAGISLGITIALMLASAVQAGFGGRPELIVDALKEGPKAIVASALTVTVMDVLIRGADVLSDVAWQAGRADAHRGHAGSPLTDLIGNTRQVRARRPS